MASSGLETQNSLREDVNDTMEHHRADKLKGKYMHSKQNYETRVDDFEGREYALDTHPDLEVYEEADSDNYESTMKYVKNKLKD